jgi:hypothetical protein
MTAINSADPARVRFATRENEQEIAALLRRMHEEAGLFDSVNEDYGYKLLSRAWDRKGGICGVVGKERVEGSIFLDMTCLWYSDNPILQEQFVYVLPEYRASTNAKDLLAFATFCSDQLKMPLIIGSLYDPDPRRREARERLYRRVLGDPAGFYFVYGAQRFTNLLKQAGDGDHHKHKHQHGIPAQSAG